MSRRPPKGSPRYDAAFYVPWVSALLVPGSGPVGGAENQMHMLTRLLAARGLRVCVVAYEVPGLPRSRDGVDYIPRVPRIGGGGARARLAEMRAIWTAVAPIDADVFVKRVFGADTGVVALAARRKRRRFVYSSANVIDFELERLDPTRANVRMFHLGVRLAHTIVVQTGEQIGMCEERFGRTPRLIRSLAEPAERSEGSGDSFAWAGRVRPYKKPLAFVELARAMPEARFTMVGVPSGPPPHGLDDEVEAACRDVPNLELLPALAREELMPVIARAVAVVNTADYEGMPNIFLEGWARGIPALALTHDPDGVIEREGVGAFAGGSFDRLVEQAGEMWEGRAGHDRLKDRCRDYIEREHSPAAVSQKWVEALGLGDPR